MNFKTPFSYHCPFCQHYFTVTESELGAARLEFFCAKELDTKVAKLALLVCPNPACREYSLFATLEYEYASTPERVWFLRPSSNAKPMPSYIPLAIAEDYREACEILSLSPKAAATLARRCLQGIIRDFWGISLRTLAAEIEAIRDKVDPLTWTSIDAVRTIGNIGAHMERDIDLVIDVHPDEAELLVGLIETVVKDWYVARHEREERLKKLVQASSDKEQQRSASGAAKKDANVTELSSRGHG